MRGRLQNAALTKNLPMNAKVDAYAFKLDPLSAKNHAQCYVKHNK